VPAPGYLTLIYTNGISLLLSIHRVRSGGSYGTIRGETRRGLPGFFKAERLS